MCACMDYNTVICAMIRCPYGRREEKKWAATAMWTSLFNRWSSFQQSWKDHFFFLMRCWMVFFFSFRSFWFRSVMQKSNVYRSFVHLDATKSHKSYLLRATEMQHIDFVLAHRTRKRIVKVLYSLIHVCHFGCLQNDGIYATANKILYSYVRELGE